LYSFLSPFIGRRSHSTKGSRALEDEEGDEMDRLRVPGRRTGRQGNNPEKKDLPLKQKGNDDCKIPSEITW